MTTDIDAILARREELKRRDPGAILLFRVKDDWGDHYQALKEDALAIYGMTLGDIASSMTFNINHEDPNQTRVRVWPSDLEALLARIVAAGKRAAVCEQVTPAEAAKLRKAEKAGKVEVERVVTEGRIEEPESWKIHDADDCPVVQVRDASGEVVCDIIEGDYSTRLARAAKIAAAPDLLAACQFAVEALGRQTKFWRDPIIARVIVDVEAAIAKATGSA